MSQDASANGNGEFKRRFQTAGWLVGVFCLIALAVGTKAGVDAKTAIEVLQDGGEVGAGTAQVMFQLGMLTLPLVIASGIFTFLLARKVLAGPAAMPVLLLLLLGSAWLTKEIGVGIEVNISAQDLKGGQARAVLTALTAYWTAYTPLPFLAAIALGVWLGVGANKGVEQ